MFKRAVLKQTDCLTNTILMIEPVAFGYNPQTSVNNYFQSKEDNDDTETQRKALEEFAAMVNLLQENGIDVIVVKDTYFPHTPDSIFPNNWISFHENAQAVFYPMYAENRRMERRIDVLSAVERFFDKKYKITDYTLFEDDGYYLEGTGSIVFDRENNKAYASYSQRTNKALFLDYCVEMKLKPVLFGATQLVNGEKHPIYHTNVMMCMADTYAVICLDAIENLDEREKVISELQSDGKTMLEITPEQMNQFAGNMLQIKNREDEKFLVMSQLAYESLDSKQLKFLKSQNKLIVPAIPTIEKNGGGSVRCMMAEVF